uniref:G-protein coupled receptors family 1 profile domain-containing protein n=1 Tax=Astyanax mexicanus TaxID=7994 RepID=A0A3B1K554_ASTMX
MFSLSLFKTMDYFDNDTEFFHCTVKVDYNSRRIGLFLPTTHHSSSWWVVLDHVWLWGDFLCRFSNLVVVLSIYASCFFLAYMSVERYLAVVRGSAPRPNFGHDKKRKRNIICAALWLVALFLAALETAHVRILHLQDPGCYLMPTHAYTEWFTSIIIIQTFIQFIVPAAVVATANILAARAVRACPEVQARSAGDVWLLHVYSAVFVVCWLPYHLIMMLMMIDILKPSLFDCNMLEQLFFAYTVVRTTALLHCLANPLLYCFLSRSFRSKLISLVLRHLPQDVAPVPGPDQPGHAAQAEATANGKKAGNAGENSTSQSEGS